VFISLKSFLSLCENWSFIIRGYT